MVVDGFRLTAWKGADGLMRLEICSISGRKTLIGLSHDWEGPLEDGRDRIMFTDNAAVIDDLTGGGDTSDDCRCSPAKMRRLGKDAVYRAWFSASRTTRYTPEDFASAIEEDRRREGRDPETGELLR